MTQKTLLKKPTTFDFLFGFLISLFVRKDSVEKSQISNKIGKYTLINTLTQSNSYQKYLTGIYRNRNSKVFIKTWFGHYKDYDYYSLVYEYLMTKTVSQILLTKKSKTPIKAPRVIGVVEGNNSLSIVFEFVEGKHIFELGRKSQVVILDTISQKLKTLPISQLKKNGCLVHGRLYYFVLLTLTYLNNLLSYPSQYLPLTNKLVSGFKYLISYGGCQLILAHRDVSPQNIIISNDKIYLLDWEKPVITFPGYDLTYSSLIPEFSYLSGLINKLNGHSDNFFKYYIPLRELSAGKKYNRNNDYYLGKILA